ncbi:Gfo/Idh/MocA family oxidoreductase [Armatimonas sp.]|uniref:Gfo/Idh/MocA family protein n=1 Tax=Armatimonas sp. TaxID=1872638 RepID=UPI00286D2059|nr:Gfo/Idh/MocA family oxidoreductase [Armatimonas sp.]
MPFRLALVGCGGQAGGDVPNFASHKEVKIVALCDPDKGAQARFGERYSVPESARFADYVKLLDTIDCDAVFCATPDHMHAPVGLKALSLGRHAYVQKPLTRGVGEARAMRLAAEKHLKSATQMGIQIHGEGSYRTAISWLNAGVLGKIQEIHSFCGKGWGGARPPRMAEFPPVNLDWNLYCGVSRKVPFLPEEFHPGNWRRWQNFGTGTLGDMACHILDPVLSGTRLTTPLSVVSHLEAPPNVLNFPYNAHITWQLAGTRSTAKTVALHWYHGDTRPPKTLLPEMFEELNTGSVVVGEYGKMVVPHWATPSVWDNSGKRVEKLPPKVESVSHYHEWVDVALGRSPGHGSTPGKCSTHFGYSGPLTEIVLMGNIASWQPQKVLSFNPDTCQFYGEGAGDANFRILPLYSRDWNPLAA